MQNRYVGDVGDFVKLSFIRALSPGYQLGIVWYLVPDETHNNDGRHIRYLENEDWRRLDPDVFDSLTGIVRRGERSLSTLEKLVFLRGCRFASDPVPLPARYAERASARAAWLADAVRVVSDCNLVFLDPDNGIEPERFRIGTKQSIKSVSFHELQDFRRRGRQIILYHHQTRRKGGHEAEIEFNADRLRSQGFARVDAIRANRYSPRVFFLLDANREVRRRAAHFAKVWGQHHVTWYESPTSLGKTHGP